MKIVITHTAIIVAAIIYLIFNFVPSFIKGWKEARKESKRVYPKPAHRDFSKCSCDDCRSFIIYIEGSIYMANHLRGKRLPYSENHRLSHMDKNFH